MQRLQTLLLANQIAKFMGPTWDNYVASIVKILEKNGRVITALYCIQFETYVNEMFGRESTNHSPFLATVVFFIYSFKKGNDKSFKTFSNHVLLLIVR